MGSRAGVLKIAAKRLGLTTEAYLARIEAGHKWCWKCHQWKPLAAFGIDTARGSGRAAVCSPCRYQRRTPGPSKAQRRAQRDMGLAWCRRCSDWKPIGEVRAGICRPHANQEDRRRYADDRTFRMERKQHAHSRKRAVAPIPVATQEALLEEFEGKCAYCGNPATTWDHIVPIASGGQTTAGNVVPACHTCNSSKKTRDVLDWLQEKGYTPSERFFARIALAESGMHGSNGPPPVDA